MSINIDDTDPAIQYTGSWQVLMNSPLEFGGGVHSTTQSGASATITFVGSRIQLFNTVTMNSGTETADYIFDGNVWSPLSRESRPTTTYYKDPWFDSGEIDDTVHVLTVSNGGGPNDSPLQLDFFTIANGSVVSPTSPAPAGGSSPSISSPPLSNSNQVNKARSTTANINSPTNGSDARPSFAKSTSGSLSATSDVLSGASLLSGGRSSLTQLSGSSVPTANATGSTATLVQYLPSTITDGMVTTATHSAPVNGPGGSPGSTLLSPPRPPIGAILGGVFGGIVLLSALLFLLCRRRKPRHIVLHDDSERNFSPHDPTTAIPFRLIPNNPFSSDLSAGPRERVRNNAKFSPFRFLSSSPPPLTSASENPISPVSNHASEPDEKDPSFSFFPATNLLTSAPGFSGPPFLQEEDAGPFRAPPSYQSASSDGQ